MSDITLRLAEACERAAEYAQALVHIGYDDVFWGSGVTTMEEAVALVDAAEADIEKYRALAAALRNAVEVSSLNGTRIVNVVLTIGDA